MHERLTAGGGAAIAGLDFNAGRSLAAQVNDPGYLDKLEKQLRPLRQQLGIGNGPDWSPDSPQYKVRDAVRGIGQVTGTCGRVHARIMLCLPALPASNIDACVLPTLVAHHHTSLTHVACFYLWPLLVAGGCDWSA